MQENDLVSDGAMTDPKGDRSKRPHQQPDPDVYMHVTEKRLRRHRGARSQAAPDRGAQLPHEIIVVMPTMSMKPGGRGLRGLIRHPGGHQGHHLYPGPPGLGHPQDGARHHGPGQRGLRRPGMPGGLRGRVRALGAGLHVRRDPVRRQTGGALRRPITASPTAAARWAWAMS